MALINVYQTSRTRYRLTSLRVCQRISLRVHLALVALLLTLCRTAALRGKAALNARALRSAPLKITCIAHSGRW